jgi:hypothetical protein
MHFLTALRHGFAAAIGVWLCLLGLPARADNFVFSTEINLDPASLTVPFAGRIRYHQTFSGLPTVALKVGDHLSGDITFGNGALRVQGPLLGMVLRFAHDPLTDVSATSLVSTVTLLGLDGTFTLPKPYTVPSQGFNATLGAVLPPTGAHQDFTFTGISYDFNILRLTPNVSPTPSSFDFSLSDFVITSGSVAIVPEPASSALFIAGLAAIGLCGWGRRSRAG